MAIDDFSTLYPGRAAAPNADYPEGRIRNESAPGVDDGTPIDEQWLNDWQGFFSALLAAGGVTPDGDPDTALDSQYLEALQQLAANYVDTLGRFWYPGGAAYTGVALNIGGQQLSPNGLFFRPDGLQFFTGGGNATGVFAYNLSTAWDLSTASYSGQSLNTTAQAPTPTGVSFRDNGTRLFVVGANNDRVYQYNLSTAWNLTTASYSGVSFSVAAQETVPRDIKFKADGTQFYVTGSSNRVYAYNLSTAWDLSTASYSGVSFDVSGQEVSAAALAFRPDGTQMFVTGSSGSVHLYNLGTAWDIATASYSGVSFAVNGQDNLPFGIEFRDDGTKFFIAGASNSNVYQYSSAVLLKAP